MVLNTREVMARRIYTHLIQKGWSITQCRRYVYFTHEVHIPYNEAKRLKIEALTINKEIIT